MRRWFLSYHSPERELAERLKTAIERKDPLARIFFAPARLRAGGSWTAQLADEIAAANAFILLIGERGVGDWQVLEYDEALDKRVTSPDFPLVVVLLEGQTAPGLPFLRRLHWIVTSDPTSETDIARLFDAASGGGANPGELWRYASPYRGLMAMEEKDSDYFFGRKRATSEVLSALARTPDRLPVLIGNSGVGKSSLAQAGVLAALKRQGWPEDAGAANSWPAELRDSREWCYLTLTPGADPLKALVEAFLDTWQFVATDPERVKHLNGWIDLLLGEKASLPDLIDATERRREELKQPKLSTTFLYIDQGEELYVRAEERQSRRFSAVLAEALPDPRLRAMMSMRSDFLGHLQNDRSLFELRQHIDVPPLGESELREIVGRPAELLAARFESDGLVDVITRRAAEDSIKDVGALPLLSYTLDDMWTQMVRRGDGTLRLPAQAFELGGVLVDRADRFLEGHPDAEAELRRVLTLRLATVREDGEPTRRRAAHSEFSQEEWRLVSELADYPNRLLVTVTTETGETYAEVAHEAIFRRWSKLREWIAGAREFLVWRGGLETARRAWEAAPEGSRKDALLMGLALAQAQGWLATRGEDLSSADRDFVEQSVERERKAIRQKRRVQALIYAGLFVIIVGLVGWINQSAIAEQIHWIMIERPYVLAEFRPYVLTREAERALKAGMSFRECAMNCPEMVVVPSGHFSMGSPTSEQGRQAVEGPPHMVSFAGPFAVAKFDVTFAQWDACVSAGGCPKISDSAMGRGERPAINIYLDQALQYVAWLDKMTGEPYRLLSEAEWEYAARAGTTTAYYWGEDVGQGNANCLACGSQWDGKQTSPVGSFKPNGFGLYDMVGNVSQMVQDCFHDDYNGAPTDGSPWTTDGCNFYVTRGNAFSGKPEFLRSATRGRNYFLYRFAFIGFRVARTLAP